MDGDHVAVLYTKVVSDDSVDSSTALIELFVGKNNQNSILSLLASNEDRVATEKLESVHRGLGQGDDAVVIVDSISDPIIVSTCVVPNLVINSYISWFAFFFFFRIAVAVSSSCRIS